MLAFHDLKSPVGAWSEATETDAGLHLKGSILVGQVALASEIHALVKSGGIRAVSIGIIIQKSESAKSH